MLPLKSCLLVLILSMTLTVSAAREAAQEAVPLVTGPWPPYTDERLPGGGVVVELVQAVFAEMGREARIDFYPWRRSEALLDHGLAWAAFPYVITPERGGRYAFSEPFMEGREVFFRFGDRLAGVEYEQLADLRPYRIGVASGYWYEEPFREAGLTLDRVPDDLSGLRKLLAGRIDLYPMNEIVGLWLIDRHFPDRRQAFTTLQRPVRHNLSAMMVSRDYPGSAQLLESFNQALARVKTRGTDRQIMERLQRQLGLKP